MSDKYVEKTFLYLLVLSVLLHLAVYQLIALIPPAKPQTEQAPTMVDLTDLPYLPEIPKSTPAPPEPKRQEKREPERRQRVAKEPAPRQERETARVVPQPTRPMQPPTLPPRPAPPAQPKQSAQPGQATEAARADTPASRRAQAPPAPAAREKGESAPVTRGEGILKPKSGEMIAPSKLFPSAGKLARMEENYRRKYGPEIEKGDANFLNTDDIRFGSFLRRFETAVYETWRYPEAALVRGIQGTTPVRITFNRNGEIVQVELLDTAGSKILDDEVMRTLKHLGPIGSFPKGFTGDVYKLIAFFQYGIGGGRLR